VPQAQEVFTSIFSRQTPSGTHFLSLRDPDSAAIRATRPEHYSVSGHSTFSLPLSQRSAGIDVETRPFRLSAS